MIDVLVALDEVRRYAERTFELDGRPTPPVRRTRQRDADATADQPNRSRARPKPRWRIAALHQLAKASRP